MKDYYVLEILTILAILFAPLVALRISVRLDEGKEITKRKLDIFRTLMATRGAPLLPQHIDALNRILVDFYEDKEVVDCWRIYPEGMKSLYEEENMKCVFAKFESLDGKVIDTISVAVKG